MTKQGNKNDPSLSEKNTQVENVESSDHNILLSLDETDSKKARKVIEIGSSEEVNRQLNSENIEMGARIVLSDPKLFFRWVNHIGQTPLTSAQRKRYYFRGERSSEYQLLPSMLRNNRFEKLKKQHLADTPLELQKKLLDRYKRYTQHLIHADHDFDAPIVDDFDTLCLAQHYGLPTLLLDWTLNPYVAAYFACSGVSNTLLFEKLARDAHITKYWVRIWVMRLKEPQAREHQTVHLEDRNQTERWNSDLGRSGMIPDGPKIVVPLVFTRRIASQVGRFVYCGYMTDKYSDGEVQSLTWFSRQNKDKMPWDRLYSLDVEFDITEKLKIIEKEGGEINKFAKKESYVEKIDEMMHHLEFMGFHAGRLFPDLGGWAQYLADGHL